MVLELHMKSPIFKKKLVCYNNIINHFIKFSDGAPDTRDIAMGIGSISFGDFGLGIPLSHYPCIHSVLRKRMN